MKIEINCPDLSKERSYPYIGKSIQTGAKVVFTEIGSGMLVEEGDGSNGYPVGRVKGGWNEGKFTPIAYPPFDLSFTE